MHPSRNFSSSTFMTNCFWCRKFPRNVEHFLGENQYFRKVCYEKKWNITDYSRHQWKSLLNINIWKFEVAWHGTSSSKFNKYVVIYIFYGLLKQGQDLELNFEIWYANILLCSDGSGSKIFEPGLVNFFSSGWVGSVIFGLGLGWENLPKKSQIFPFFPFGSKKYHWVGSKSNRVKDGLAFYLLRVKSML